jgi:hypothetical protein
MTNIFMFTALGLLFYIACVLSFIDNKLGEMKR